MLVIAQRLSTTAPATASAAAWGGCGTTFSSFRNAATTSSNVANLLVGYVWHVWHSNGEGKAHPEAAMQCTCVCMVVRFAACG